MVTNLQAVPVDSLIRGYPSDIQMSVTFSIVSAIPIAQVEEPRTNFNITIQLAAGDLGTSVGVPLGPVQKVDNIIGDLSSALNSTFNMTLTSRSGVRIPRDICNQVTHACFRISPGNQSSYTESDNTTNIKCVAIIAYKNCIGEYPLFV